MRRQPSSPPPARDHLRMTTYGTIPSCSSSPCALDSTSLAKHLGSLAPWPELVDARAISLPSCSAQARVRVRTNGARFAANYAVVILVLVFLSLLWHPVSLIAFLVCLTAWFFLYFLRDEGRPLVVSGRSFDDRTVLVALSAATLAVLLLTGVTANVLVSLMIGVSLVLLHAALRRPEDLAATEESAGDGKLNAATTTVTV